LNMDLVKSAFPVVTQSSGNDQLTIQILNVCGYIATMVVNFAAQRIPGFLPATLSTITSQTNARIDPAGYAFAIWGVIYTLLGVFTVYQALPDDLTPGRNNDLIFN